MTPPPRPDHSDPDQVLEWLAEVVGRALVEPRRAPTPDDPVSRAQAVLWGAFTDTPPQ